MTCKLEGIWDLAGAVTAEDVRHLKNRVLLFSALAPIQGQLTTTTTCAESFSKWLVSTAALAATALGAPPLTDVRERGQASSSGGRVTGLTELCEAASIPQEHRTALEEEIVDLGAVNVQEMTADDWKSLGTWQQLRPLEQRRVLRHV